MVAFRDRYAEVKRSGVTVLAISTDKPERLGRFRESVGAPFSFVPDPEGTLTRLYGVKVPILTMAKRVTFVVGSDGLIQEIFRGRRALDPNGAITASVVC